MFGSLGFVKRPNPKKLALPNTLRIGLTRMQWLGFAYRLTPPRASVYGTTLALPEDNKKLNEHSALCPRLRCWVSSIKWRKLKGNCWKSKGMGLYWISK